LPEHIGGTELYTRSLASYQAREGHNVSIFVPARSSPGWPEPALEEDVRVYRYPVGSRGVSARFASTFRSKRIENAFTRFLDLERPEIVHIQHLIGQPVSIIDLIVERSIPYVLTLHDYWYVCANAQLLTNYDNTICQGPRWWLNCARCALARINMSSAGVFSPLLAPPLALRNRQLRKALAGAERFIAPTSFVRDIYVEHGLPDKKISVISHGIEAPNKPVTRVQQKQNELKVAYIGGLSWQKGVHILVEAFNRMPEEGARLAIWGDQAAFPEYVISLQKLFSHSGIALEGRLSREDLWSTLAVTDVVVVPSLWYETASLVIQEAFAAGIPVVVSKIGALIERVSDGIDGVLVPPNDIPALADVLKGMWANPQVLRQLSNGIRPVRTVSQHAEEIERLYIDVKRELR
jgi:glycosyltransferase involved in cell wall biosynthesis